MHLQVSLYEINRVMHVSVYHVLKVDLVWFGYCSCSNISEISNTRRYTHQAHMMFDHHLVNDRTWTYDARVSCCHSA